MCSRTPSRLYVGTEKKAEWTNCQFPRFSSWRDIYFAQIGFAGFDKSVQLYANSKHKSLRDREEDTAYPLSLLEYCCARKPVAGEHLLDQERVAANWMATRFEDTLSFYSLLKQVLYQIDVPLPSPVTVLLPGWGHKIWLNGFELSIFFQGTVDDAD